MLDYISRPLALAARWRLRANASHQKRQWGFPDVDREECSGKVDYHLNDHHSLTVRIFQNTTCWRIAGVAAWSTDSDPFAAQAGPGTMRGLLVRHGPTI